MAGMATMTNGVLVEASDRWMLPLEDTSVNQCCIDYAVTLRCENGVEVRIEAPFIFRTPDGVEQLLVPEGDPVRLAPVLGLSRLVVVEAMAFKDGHLELAFNDGSNISVAATEDLEPWEVAGPGGLRVVSVPGGEVAVWQPTQD
jgi:hypothetical protein